MVTDRHDNIKLLRCIACLWVLAVHLSQVADFQGVLKTYSDFGGQCPMIFFIISAFVCMMSLDKNGNTLDFYKKRAINIFPLYYMVILIHFIVYQVVLKQVPIDNTGLYWLRYILCISALVPSESDFWVNLGATWTVGSFLIFYIVAPFINKKVRGIWPAIFLCILRICMGRY